VPDVEIRSATEADVDAIAEVLRIAFSEFVGHYTPEALEYVTPAADEIVGRFAEGPMWVAELDGKVVATVSVVREPEQLYIRSMAVLPNAQGHGIGGRLLATVEGYAAENGISTLFLYTTHFSTAAIKLYEKHGFIRGRDTTAEEWCGTPGLEMWKFLKEDMKTNATGS
jgi:N-acetylglutamate synthase-like GNAT family acetyltransferase